MFIYILALFISTNDLKAESGLKKVNYQNITSDQHKSEEQSKSQLSDENLQKIKLDVEKLRLKQIESQKTIDELDSEDE